LLTLLLLLGVSLIGCGPTQGVGKASVSGKVTVGGKAPINGTTIKFISTDGKESSSQVDADGSYVLADVPLGECKVVVQGGTPPTGMITGDMPGMPKKSGGVPVPRKYEQPGELTFNVQKGKNTKDFDLAP